MSTIGAIRSSVLTGHYVRVEQNYSNKNIQSESHLTGERITLFTFLLFYYVPDATLQPYGFLYFTPSLDLPFSFNVVQCPHP